MSVSKVIFNSTPFIDVTADTVDANTLAESYVALSKSGMVVNGIQPVESSETAIIERSLSGDYTNSRITQLRSNAFTGCASLERINLPSVTTFHGDIVSGSYLYLPGITSVPHNKRICVNGVVDLPNVVSVGISCFNTSSVKMTVLYMPSCTSIGTNFMTVAQQNLVKLVCAENPFTNINYSLYKTPSLKALVIKRTSVAGSPGASALAQSGIATNDDAYIYVPRDLVEDYKVATNWSVYADKFRAIEDYPLIDAPTTWLPTGE